MAYMQALYIYARLDTKLCVGRRLTV